MPSTGQSDGLTRRGALAAGVAVASALAGCGTSERESRATTSREETEPPTSNTATPTDETPVLRVVASGSMAAVVPRAAAVWNANPASYEWWPRTEPESRLADRFAVEHGLEATGERASPPFRVLVTERRDSGVADDLEAGSVDVAVPDAGGLDVSSSGAGALDTRAVARAGCVFVVSSELRDAVAPVALEDVRACYSGRMSNWAALGGPDRPVWVVTTAAASGSDGCVRRHFSRDVEFEELGQRYGKSENRLAAAERRDDVLADVRVGTDGGPDPVALRVDGRTIQPTSLDYPTVRGVFAHTRADLRPEAAAFVDFLRSGFVQREFVERVHGLAPLDASDTAP